MSSWAYLSQSECPIKEKYGAPPLMDGLISYAILEAHSTLSFECRISLFTIIKSRRISTGGSSSDKCKYKLKISLIYLIFNSALNFFIGLEKVHLRKQRINQCVEIYIKDAHMFPNSFLLDIRRLLYYWNQSGKCIISCIYNVVSSSSIIYLKAYFLILVYI